MIWAQQVWQNEENQKVPISFWESEDFICALMCIGNTCIFTFLFCKRGLGLKALFAYLTVNAFSETTVVYIKTKKIKLKRLENPPKYCRLDWTFAFIVSVCHSKMSVWACYDDHRLCLCLCVCVVSNWISLHCFYLSHRQWDSRPASHWMNKSAQQQFTVIFVK